MSAAPTVAALLTRARRRLRGTGEPAQADWLLCHALGCDRSRLYAAPDLQPSAAVVERLESMLERCAGGAPLAYVIGRQPFWTLELVVTRATLIPRPDTETLVAAALRCAAVPATARVLDLGTGSGAVALALCSERPGWRFTATDISADALQVARDNAAALGLELELLRSDWFAALPRNRRFDLIVSNPPYVAASDPHLDDPSLAAEPRSALVAGPEGLEALRRIAVDAVARLFPDGWLWLEHGWDQGAAVRTLLRHLGYRRINTHRDPGDRERVTGGQRPRAQHVATS